MRISRLNRIRGARAALILVPGILLIALSRHHRRPVAPPASESESAAQPVPLPELILPVPEPERGLLITFPTPQTALQNLEDPSVYMPTASGRVISAHYGSTRTNNAGRAVFHEGVDIGPTRRDRRGHALDEIFAVSDGQIAYINRIAGNSTYGVYIVLTHEEEDFGTYYTLYAHLTSVPRELRAGQAVQRGDVIGIMGHTSSFSIPPQRAHLHFEVGMILNQHFHAWYRAKQRTPNHGTYHGHNLNGLNPMLLLLKLDPETDNTRFSIAEAIEETQTAFTLALHATGQLDYFRRHPTLWEGPSFSGGIMVLELCEAGTPLRGRAATAEEGQHVTRSRPQVLDVDTTVLGRNGRRQIQRSGNTWQLTPAGSEHLEILTYRAGR
ncbi:MAG: M23 family metallopeptidase [Verrucomicrobia bacterium]|nr:M23 family metallopeptidase [Verrucomicrobiota bacterium]MCH8527490.1 M23 family metallopeptidase [Kiritimatiellia bacterium]